MSRLRFQMDSGSQMNPPDLQMDNPQAGKQQRKSDLRIRNLSIEFKTHDGIVKAVNNVSFDLPAGSTLGLVGESGSGKSQIVYSILGLLASNAKVSGEVLFRGQNLLTLSTKELNRIRGKEIGIIFQDSMTSLNPYLRVEKQLSEALIIHEGISATEARQRALDALDAVKVPEAKRRLRSYPHELSGGMRQRIVIAMTLICRPSIILADEPTTALDVTVQAQIMSLLEDLQKDFGASVLLITHDLGVVANFCQDTVVLYGGRLMEKASSTKLFTEPRHPYTQALRDAIPNIFLDQDELTAIQGSPPNMLLEPSGCPFAPRCPQVIEQCHGEIPPLLGTEHQSACFLTRETAAKGEGAAH